MPRYRVTGDIVTGAFVHYVNAASSEQAQEIAEATPSRELSSVSPERDVIRIDSVEEMAKGEES